jgi:hypothetical protein
MAADYVQKPFAELLAAAKSGADLDARLDSVKQIRVGIIGTDRPFLMELHAQGGVAALVALALGESTDPALVRRGLW